VLRRDLLAIGGCGALALLLLAYSGVWNRDQPPGPRTLQEVAAIAERLGLHHRSDVYSGDIQSRLVVADQPTTFEGVNRGHFGEPDHPCWRGMVAVCTPCKAYLRYTDPDHGVVWGDVFLYGDPALIRKLIAAHPLR
jgi:hypothetical protein